MKCLTLERAGTLCARDVVHGRSACRRTVPNARTPWQETDHRSEARTANTVAG
jgi:hypothetical protein